VVSALPTAPARTRRAAAPVRSSLITRAFLKSESECRRSHWPGLLCACLPEAAAALLWAPWMAAASRRIQRSAEECYGALLLVGIGSQLQCGKQDRFV